jgi:hypothetical protein
MERRQRTTENTDLPQPWDDTPITRAAWEKHRDYLMSGYGSGFGTRPDGWWIHERNREPPIPYKQSRILFEMGELKGAELERCVGWGGTLTTAASTSTTFPQQS